MNVKELLDAFDEIKPITKRVPTQDWTLEFREIANIAHRTLAIRHTSRHSSALYAAHSTATIFQSFVIGARIPRICD